MSLKIDLRLSEQTFAGKNGEVFTLHRHQSVYELHSNTKGLDSVYTLDEYATPKALKQAIANRLAIVIAQRFRP